MFFSQSFMQINVLLFIALTLGIIEWKPSIIIENFVNISIITLYVISSVLVYKIINHYHERDKKNEVYKSGAYTMLLLCYMGIFAMITVGITYDKSNYVKEYTLNNQSFYIYKNIDLKYEVSVNESLLPIRSLPIASYINEPSDLIIKNNYVYVIIDKSIEEKIYDLKKKKIYKKNKENK